MSGPAPASRIVAIYLNDHLAGATAGVELARRMVQEHGRSAYRGDLETLAAEISRDRRALLELMASLDIAVRRYKICAAWLSERLGRLKPNGRVVRRSPLSMLVEVEALRVGVEGKVLLWRTLLASAAWDQRLDTVRIQELLDGARQQSEVLDSLHGEAVSALLSTQTSERTTEADT
ncbi:hypothetical protein ACH492_06040 [Streptomyces sp. NPDC019443]|uniref:hypothetical protein n=1 Tax=Streptomyces sp. NPDC019443 TaxID=3365061 RepID=UPI0037B45135